jgi:hypothetical protein
LLDLVAREQAYYRRVQGPQRVAIGQISSATYELTQRAYKFRDALGKSPSEPSGQEEFDQAVRALFDVLQVFHVGRLSIVDAQCFETMGAAYLNIATADEALSGTDDETPKAVILRTSADAFVSLVNGLNHDVYELVVKGKERLSPAQSWFGRLTQARARKKLDAKYFAANQSQAASR